MVDFRPLLFANALVLMLLVSAGFANLQPDQVTSPVSAAAGDSPTTAVAPEPVSEPAMSPGEIPGPAIARTQSMATAAMDQMAVIREIHDLPASDALAANPAALLRQTERPDPVQGNPEFAQPEALTEEVTDGNSALSSPPSAPPKAAPEQPQPASATLVVRSNVFDDQVSINGRDYGSTRLDLELPPGTYEIVVSKAGHQTWEGSVQLSAGVERRISAELAAFRSVHYRSGTWRGGIVSGSGTYEDEGGLRYEGEFRNRQFHGTGLARFANGDRYKGDWREGKPEGRGTLRRANGDIYSGQFSNGDYSGEGTLTEASGDIYTGNWNKGSLYGAGSLTSSDGLFYVGGFRKGLFHGEGTLTYPDGRHYEGGFADGKFHGKGSLIYADGKKYQGQFMDGDYHGQGNLLNPNGSQISASFRYGVPYGQAKLSTPEGEIFTARSSEPGVCYRENSYRATQCPPMPGW